MPRKGCASDKANVGKRFEWEVGLATNARELDASGMEERQ